MLDDKHIRLTCEPLEIGLAPEIGGSIAHFDFTDAQGKKWPILRAWDRQSRQVLAMASFPLVPYCNRIRDGCFEFRGRTVRMRPNMTPDPSPLHGQGWLAAWSIQDRAETSATLTFHHDPAEWPWRYEARQQFHLDTRGLSLTMTCRNLSDEPMPCGLGHHPYFPCSAETELDTRVEAVWTIDDKVLPTDRIAAEGRYDLKRRHVCGQGLDNGFAEWSGEALIATPGAPFAIRLASPDTHFFQLYSPAEGGLFVAEPVTHANAALNEPETRWSNLGLRILAPGAEMSLQMRIEVSVR